MDSSSGAAALPYDAETIKEQFLTIVETKWLPTMKGYDSSRKSDHPWHITQLLLHLNNVRKAHTEELLENTQIELLTFMVHHQAVLQLSTEKEAIIVSLKEKMEQYKLLKTQLQLLQVQSQLAHIQKQLDAYKKKNGERRIKKT